MGILNSNAKKQVVILGAGFGGLAAAKALRKAHVDITLLDQHNYHLFQPLLYQVATANFSPADIALPVRHVFKRQANITVLMETVTAIDKHSQTIITQLGNRYHYDYLVIATGARHSYFGHQEWQEHAPGLKCLKEATAIREKVLFAFEKAEATHDERERKRYLTFVIVGAGPTGVEMAGAVCELAKHALANEFQHINPLAAKVMLVEAAPRILGGFPEQLAKAAAHRLRKMGVEIWTEEKVTDIQRGSVKLSSCVIGSHTVIWAAGVKASQAAEWLDVEADRGGRIVVKPDLSVPGFANIFAIGDTSACFDPRSQSYLPGLAQVAKQQGRYVGNLIHRHLKGKSTPAFRYRNYGNLATIGRKYAIADFGKLTLAGTFAYVLWWIVHIYFLIGFRNRFAVTLNWLWSHFTFQRSVRLIVEEPSVVEGEKS
jgi:NADH dehydrogenase